MRERLIAVLVGLTVAVIACFGIPRAYVLADLVRDQEQRELERSAQLLAALVDERAAQSGPVTQTWLTGYLADGDLAQLTVDGSTVTAGRPAAGDDSDLTVAIPLSDGGDLVLTRDGDVVDERVTQAVLPLLAVGIGLVAVSVVVGVVVARRLSRPFQELARAADQLGTGRFDVDVPHYGVPEAEAIGDALRTAGARLDRLVRREREFAVNASHELLSPITGIRLELEDVARWPETPSAVADEVNVAVAGLDDLATRVRGVLEGDRGERLDGCAEIDLAAATAAAVERWRPRVESAGRRIHHETGLPVTTRLPAEPVRQILEGLIAQAHRVGAGTITVDTVALPTHLRVRVADEGARRGASDVIHRRTATDSGTDPDLALAAETAESLGGYVMIDDGTRACAVLMLPRSAD